MSKLVIVESPTKARTIRNYLPSEYRVEASMGHVRDLPASAEEIPENVKGEKWAQLGVNVEANFEPLYVIPKDKKKIVKLLQDALKEADELVLATDEDREGESISWHLLQILKPKIPIKRMVFHEITQEAIRKALKDCRQVDEKLVRAQETRRILDRLVGYTLSPLLWKKIARGLSAGRVQSVAVRVLVNRERARLAFKQGSYWDLQALLVHKTQKFGAKLVTVAGVKIATGADFDPDTGQIIAGKKVTLLNEEDAKALQARLIEEIWTVKDIEERAVNRKPSPPFTTSTLQQESNRKLRLSARETMRVAQSLYEQGYITYMRTDSVHLSDQAIEAARSCVMEKYGAEYLSPKPRQYTTKAKGAQEAHEAIRPAGSSFRTPRETGLNGQELSLYDLVWKRTVACQMADSRQTHISVDLEVADAGFRATGKRIDFPGYLRAYVEGSDDPNAAIEDQEVILPPLKAGDHPECEKLEAIPHETQPPARFTEASLVKTLESEGIGRPSTYASIIGTIADRGYAKMQSQALVPTFTAFAVTTLLEKHFPDLVDTSFTAKMEQTLDDISTGEAQWLPYLKKFYSGETGLDTLVKQQESQIDRAQARTIELDHLEPKIRLGSKVPYVESINGDEVLIASIPADWTPADADPERIAELLRQKAEGPVELGKYPESGESVYFFKIGPHGPYVQVGQKTEENPKPKRASIPKTQNLEEVTLDTALNLLSLPRLLGNHPGTGGKIKAAIGPFGPYIVHEQGKGEKDYRSLKASDDIFTITLERALELLAEPKKGRGGKSKTAKEPLRTLGNHPDDEEVIEVHEGRYGPYIKHGKTNVSLPKDTTVEEVTMATALELLATKSTTQKSTGTRTKSTKSTKSKTSTTTRKTTTKKAAKTS
ncbi:type I DNA topoisomerase [Merismopedia glauca]|uniref:DNA topoisomerase 1 n=1 Tax=Merismopedia glauca CCAP 1448/3 TaxID=1296344 RepID=A0A2T1C480_9CYAN|nr:type I DNA topoisomerase [Merismopedia glauca]PSB03092.1 type I DNA topoisomerase [Merismopedia glauca CCAP 1448/3]